MKDSVEIRNNENKVVEDYFLNWESKSKILLSVLKNEFTCSRKPKRGG